MHRIKENFNSILKIFKQILSTNSKFEFIIDHQKEKSRRICSKRNEIKLEKE